MASEGAPSPATQENLDVVLKDWAASLVRYLDMEYLSRSKPGQVIIDMVGPFFERAGFKLEKVQFLREIFHGYGEPYPLMETVPIENILEILPAMNIGVELCWDITGSRLRVVCVGRLTVTRDEVKSTGLSIIEVTDAEPREGADKKASALEEPLKVIFLRAIAFFLFELLKKIWKI